MREGPINVPGRKERSERKGRVTSKNSEEGSINMKDSQSGETIEVWTEGSSTMERSVLRRPPQGRTRFILLWQIASFIL
jgi:hypothetical protein